MAKAFLHLPISTLMICRGAMTHLFFINLWDSSSRQKACWGSNYWLFFPPNHIHQLRKSNCAAIKWVAVPERREVVLQSHYVFHRNKLLVEESIRFRRCFRPQSGFVSDDYAFFFTAPLHLTSMKRSSERRARGATRQGASHIPCLSSNNPWAAVLALMLVARSGESITKGYP